MASLTHVCMWTDKGWKRITADEAARIYPRGGVSAHSGLFMCELCGQYVLLTDGNIQVRHFRHSSSEKSKDCPERTFGTAASVSYSSGEHELPIRLKIESRTAFSLEMGFIRVPKQIFNRGLSLHIKAGRYTGERFVYSGERLDPDKISYVSIGTRPYEEYRLSIENGSEQLYNFWPQILGGLDPTGTIFDGKTLKKLPYDADVEVGKRYYLLKVNRLYYHSIHINVQEVCSKSISCHCHKGTKSVTFVDNVIRIGKKLLPVEVKVYIYHKIKEGLVDMTFPNAADHINVLNSIVDWLDKHGVNEVTAKVTGGAGALRIYVPELDMEQPFEQISESKLNECFKAIVLFHDLAGFWANAMSVGKLKTEKQI